MLRMFSTIEAAAALGVTPQSVRNWTREGRLRPSATTLGGRCMYTMETVLDSLDKMEAPLHLDGVAGRSQQNEPETRWRTDSQ